MVSTRPETAGADIQKNRRHMQGVLEPDYS